MLFFKTVLLQVFFLSISSLKNATNWNHFTISLHFFLLSLRFREFPGNLLSVEMMKKYKPSKHVKYPRNAPQGRSPRTRETWHAPTCSLVGTCGNNKLLELNTVVGGGARAGGWLVNDITDTVTTAIPCRRRNVHRGRLMNVVKPKHYVAPWERGGNAGLKTNKFDYLSSDAIKQRWTRT